ncbi:MAG: ACT domain-containing protein [Candidatus Oleimicrobiaceae bacterium]
MQKVKSVFVTVENKPGVMGRLCQELAKHQINIEALGAFGGTARLRVSDSMKAVELLRAAGYHAEEREVLVAELDNRPGELAKLGLTLAEAGLNIEYCYGTMNPGQSKGVVILEVSDLDRALAAVGKWAVEGPGPGAERP